jgi:hypothetical protein
MSKTKQLISGNVAGFQDGINEALTEKANKYLVELSSSLLRRYIGKAALDVAFKKERPISKFSRKINKTDQKIQKRNTSINKAKKLTKEEVDLDETRKGMPGIYMDTKMDDMNDAAAKYAGGDAEDIKKLYRLAQAGLFDVHQMPALRRALNKNITKQSPQEKAAFVDTFRSILDVVLGSLYQRTRQAAMAKEEIELVKGLEALAEEYLD